MALKELRANYRAKLEEARALLAGEQTAETRTNYQAKMAEVGEIAGDIANAEQLEQRDSEERKRQEAEEAELRNGRPNLPNPGAEHTDKRSIEEKEKAYRSALLTYMRDGDKSELRAQQSTVGTNGGYSIPTTLLTELEKALLTYGGVAAHVRQLTTTAGEPINWPVSNNTTLAATVLAENTAQSDQTIVMATKALAVSTLVTGVVKVPFQLMQDSVFSWEEFARGELGEMYARGLANYVGGISTDSSFDALPSIVTSSVTSAAPGAVALGDITSLFGAVDPAYASNGTWVMNRNTQLYLASQRNAYGTPVFPLDATGQLSNLYGRPIVIDTTLPNIGAGNRAILFGDLSKYILRKVPGFEIKRLDERYAELGQVAFLGFFRAGSRYLDAGTHPIQALVQHA